MCREGAWAELTVKVTSVNCIRSRNAHKTNQMMKEKVTSVCAGVFFVLKPLQSESFEDS